MSGPSFNTSFGTGQFGVGSHSSDKRAQTSDYKKIFCAYHSTEFLTNFLEECLMPLCPTCVVEHTEQHYQRGQKPQYVNLHEALHDARQYCYSSIVKLEEYDRRNTDLGNYIHGLPEYIRKQLGECKEKLFLLIEEQFQQYETKLIDDIRGKYAEEGVYSRKQCEDVKQFISNQIEVLYDKITQLKGEQCLASLIKYYESDNHTLDEELAEVSQYVERNRKAGGLYISLNLEDTAKEMEGFCQRAVSVEYIQDQPSLNTGRNLEITSGKKSANPAVRRIGGSSIKGSGVKGSTSKVLSYSSHKHNGGYDY